MKRKNQLIYLVIVFVILLLFSSSCGSFKPHAASSSRQADDLLEQVGEGWKDDTHHVKDNDMEEPIPSLIG